MLVILVHRATSAVVIKSKTRAGRIQQKTAISNDKTVGHTSPSLHYMYMYTTSTWPFVTQIPTVPAAAVVGAPQHVGLQAAWAVCCQELDAF